MAIGTRAGVPNQRLSSGAGRSMDWLWPDPATPRTLNAAPNMNAISRGGTVRGAAVSGGVTWQAGADDGRPVARIRADGASMLGPQFVNLARICPAWKPSPACNVPSPYAVARIIATMAAPSAAVDSDVAGDYGLQLNVGTLGDGMLTNLRAGIGIHLADATKAQLIVRSDAGVLSRAVISGAGFTRLTMHTYELRIFDATATTYGRLEVYIDGTQCALPANMASWFPGTVLPSGGSTPENAQGFMVDIWNRQAAGVDLNVGHVQIIMGPTLADVL